MAIHDIDVRTLRGEPLSLGEFKGKALLIVNVASKCGFTPQYEGLQALHQRYAGRGFSVIGMPCNQFGEQEPGSTDEIEQFCKANYGVTFPILEKADVNGPNRHPLFEQLTRVPNHKGETGDVRWNFEKFLIDPEGEPVARFSTRMEPLDERLTSRLEQVLPG